MPTADDAPQQQLPAVPPNPARQHGVLQLGSGAEGGERPQETTPETVSAPIPISGAPQPHPSQPSSETEQHALSASPAAAFAKLGLSSSHQSSTPHLAAPTEEIHAHHLLGGGGGPKWRIPSSQVVRRRISNATLRKPDTELDLIPIGVGSCGGRESTSLPASSLLLLSTSAEAAVLESIRFEQGGTRSLAPAGFGTLAVAHTYGGGAKGGRKPRGSVSRGSVDKAGVGVAAVEREGKREKGQMFKCEKCAKVYRHPQCLVKHRWEHTAYWADASKLMLSKHQQVQMLEAAAILATPSGSLPESRSMWPAAVSPSAAGLYGSDKVNLDLIRRNRRPTKASAPRRQRLASSVPLSSHAHHNAYAHDAMSISAAGDRDAASDDELDSALLDEDEDEEEDDVMFEMSIDGDDSNSTSGSTADTTSGKGSGDEKDNGYASSSARSGSGLSAPRPGISFSVSAPPPMGFFETRDRSTSSHQGRALTASSPMAVPPTSHLPCHYTVSSHHPHGGSPNVAPWRSPYVAPVSVPLSIGMGYKTAEAHQHVASSVYVQAAYAASDLRSSSGKDDEMEDRWARREGSADEVMDMEL